MKDIEGYEGLYKISKDGKVFSVSSKRFRKPQTDRDGYLKINLSKNGKVKFFLVHRLVALTYIPNPFNFKTVNHKDGNKENNNIENLEWASHSKNLKHAYRTGLRTPRGGENHPTSKLTIEEVKNIKKRLNLGHSIPNIASDYKVALGTIYNIKSGLNWGYVKIS